jgi:hypothetical protein
MTLEEALVRVWQQTLVDGAADVEPDGKTFPVRETPRKRLREVDFVFDEMTEGKITEGEKTRIKPERAARVEAGRPFCIFVKCG